MNIQEAKTHLSRLVEEARAGEDIVLAKAGRPLVRLVPVTAKSGTRPSGQWRGRGEVPDTFDDEDSEVVALFERSSR